MKTGIFLGFLVTTILAWGQKSEPFIVPEGVEGVPAVVEDSGLTSFILTVEVFSVPMTLAAEVKRSRKRDVLAYREFLAAVKSGEGIYDKLMEARGMVTKPVRIEETKGQADPDRIGKVAVDLVFEVFSLPFSEAAELQRRSPDDAQLYHAMVARLRRGEATQEVFQVLAARSGKKASVRDGPVMRYPTRFEPPGGSFLTVPSVLAHEEMLSPTLPCSMALRKLGWSCSVSPELERKRGLISLKIDLLRQDFVKNDLWGFSRCQHEIARFSRESIETELWLKPGQVAFVGTMGEEPQAGNRVVHLAFIKADLPGEELKGENHQSWRMDLEVFALSIAEARRIKMEFTAGNRHQASS